MSGVRAVLAALVLAGLSAPANATTCVVTEFSASGTLTAERLNQRIRQHEACVNGKIGNVNWNTAEPMAVTNLANPNAIYSQSWEIIDNNAGATVGQDIIAAVAAHTWRVPVSSTIIGMTIKLRGCAACSVTVVLNKAGSAVKTFAAVATTTIQTDFTISSAIANTQDLTIDVSGTMTGVKGVDIVVYEKAQHQG